jgi:D-sedoheptulose 7-phosphate isomerase
MKKFAMPSATPASYNSVLIGLVAESFLSANPLTGAMPMAGSVCTSAKNYLTELSNVMAKIDCAGVESFGQLLFDAWKNNRQVFFFGNGGSASTASHYVLDLLKTASVPGQRHLRAFGMNDNIGILTAVGNDLDYAQAFGFPLSAYAELGDIAVAISCSGNSPNILHACQIARDKGLTVVALTGFSGGRVSKMADLHINIPSDNYGIVEDLHLSMAHMVAQILKHKVEQFAGETASCKS